MYKDARQRRRENDIVTSYCAATNDLSTFHSLTHGCALADLNQIIETARCLHASQLLRALRRASLRQHNEHTSTQLTLRTEKEGTVWLGNQQIGSLTVLFKPVLPFEAQARISYEVFFDRFFNHLAVKYKIVLVHENDLTSEIFVPNNVVLDLELLWQEVVSELFSLSGLRRTFIALVNSVKLTNRGFSALDVPILGADQALILAGFNLTNIFGRRRGMNKRRQNIAVIENKLLSAKREKDRERLTKQYENAIAECQAFEQRYERLFELWEETVTEFPTWSQSVQHMSAEFNGVAATQIAPAYDKIAKAGAQIGELAVRMREEAYFHLPVLLQTTADGQKVRHAGDNNTTVCYSCGREISKKQPVFQTNTFIFASPSQRLQSGASQTQPNICGVCAALAFVSPIKLGEGRLVLRLYEREPCVTHSVRYMLEDQLRMLTIGELNVVAGRYVLLKANERIGNDLVYDKLGGVQYAIYKIAMLLPAEIFAQYLPEVILGETHVTIAGRHVVWVNHLMDIFPLPRTKWTDKSQLVAFGRTLRHIQRDLVIHAIYELMCSGIISANAIGRVRLAQLETLRSEHVRWLEMEYENNKADFYRDVSGMTGLLYAFCSYVYSKSTGNEQRIEVRKLIERLDDPYNFNYTAAGNTKQEVATLFRQDDMYFSYDEAKRILVAIGVATASREQLNERNQSQLKVYFDDIVAAYTWLWEERYPKTTEQRDFLYALKLSLHARFPDLIERKLEDK